MNRLVKTLIIFFIVSFLAYSQNVSYKFSSGQILTNVQKVNKIAFCSIEEISKVFNFKINDNSKLRKKTLVLEKGSATFSLNNPFVLLKSAILYDKVYQMISDTKLINSGFFMPVADFVKIYKVLNNVTLTYSEIKSTSDTKKEGQDSLKSNNDNLISKTRFDVYGINYSIKSNGIKLSFNTLKNIKKQVNRQTKDTFYLKLFNCTVDTIEIDRSFNGGLFKKIQSKQKDNDAVIRIELRFPVESKDVIIEKDKINVLFYVNNETMKKVKNSEAKNTKQNGNSKFDVIIIDPGHGGKDGGATGYKGTKEKEINLSIALKLNDILKKNMKEVKVEFTRSDDTFIELYKRGQFANEKKGDLFISLHANSSPKRPGDVSGSEIYLLRPGRTEEAIRIAELENSVIKLEDGFEQRYKKLDEENHILVSMNQTANVKHSEKFAEFLNSKFGKNLEIENRGVKQAGFYVLIGASMPGVLVESGYLNHPGDEKYLNTDKGQDEIVNSIYQAIIDYKKYFQDISK